MGVPGLWDIIRSTGKQRSLTHLAVVDGFEKNSGGKRGYRIGIDASIWFFHASGGKEGENPELRTMFFRLARLLSVPFLPLFVFDGPKRPKVKRGKRIGGKEHWLTEGMKNIIAAYGFEWRQAPGEAEAELAYLNRIGIIDAILSDDVDNFLFGAQVVVRNPSSSLSGNASHPVKNSAGKDDGNHVMIYRAADIEADEEVALTLGGFILIGLLSGGDYNEAGLPRCGKQIAYRLAKCGFGDELVHAVRTLSPDELPTFLDGWRDALRTELRTDASGILGRKYVSLAASVTNAVPDMDILKSYMCPVTSESEGRPVRPVEWNNEHSLSEIARCCEIYFEWGIKEMIVKRFRTVLWHASILRLLRRGAMDVDQLQSVASKRDGPVTPTKRKRAGDDLPPDTPSTNLAKHLATLGFQSPEKPMRAIREEEDDGLIVSITRSRTHASTDGLLEYRLEINPAGLVEMTESGIRGLRTKQNGPADFADNEDVADSDGENESVKKAKKPSKPPPKPDDHLLIWIPASIVKMAKGDHVTEFEESESRKRMKKEKKTAGVGKGKKKAVLKAVSETEEEDPFSPPPKSKASIAAMTKPKPASTTTAKTKRASHSPPLPKKPAAPVKKDTTARSSAHVTSQPKQLTAAASAARLLFASNSLPPADDSESDDPYADLLEQRASSRHIAKPRSPLLPIAKEGNRKSAKQPETEDRDDDWMLPTKSKTSSSFPTAKPKPNGKHPNRMLVDDSEDDSGEENTRPRPVSPSPQVSKVASTKFPKPSPTRTSSLKSAYSANDVIELSSDSDVAPPTQLFRPIAEAKAKAPSNSSIASRQQGSSQITKKKATATTGVIDLT